MREALLSAAKAKPIMMLRWQIIRRETVVGEDRSMDSNNEKVLYNVLFPIWLLIFFPSYLWLILIPANYLIDRIVLKWSLWDMPDKGMSYLRHGREA